MVSKPSSRQSTNNLPRWYEHLVDLSVKETPKVTRKLKLVGDPYEFIEYVDKQYVPNPNNDPALKGKTVRVPFPDADVNKSFTRIGNSDDPANCPWKKLGYIATSQFAQNCFEKQEDGSWEVKILKKGKSIFREIAKEQIDRMNNEDLDDDDPKHFGTRVSPCVRITAEATGLEGPKSVEYKVSYDPKSTTITDDMIEMLRKYGEPSAEKLEDTRISYIQASKKDPSLPEYEDFYYYGFQLNRIFQHTPIKNTAVDTVQVSQKTEVSAPVTMKPVAKPVVVEEDEDDEPVVVKTAKKPAPKPVVIEEDDDEDSMGWMSED